VHVSLGGQIDPLEWAYPYLDDEHVAYVSERLFAADALLLGRRTYEGLSAAYPVMPSNPFVDRMNAIPKYVASRTLRTAGWNATVIPSQVVPFVADLKDQQDLRLVKYGNGPLDVALMEHQLIDEIHILLGPVAVGKGRRMFEELEGTIHLYLAEAKQFRSGVMLLVYRREPWV
jgi:dihydrofolate reductase